jgi:hypothetical protein
LQQIFGKKAGFIVVVANLQLALCVIFFPKGAMSSQIRDKLSF